MVVFLNVCVRHLAEAHVEKQRKRGAVEEATRTGPKTKEGAWISSTTARLYFTKTV